MSIRAWARSVAATAAVLVMVAGCSGGGSPATGAGAGAASVPPAGGGGRSGAGAPGDGKVVADVCGLLTTDELKSVLGIDFPAGTVEDVSGTTATCDWEAKSGISDALVSLSVEAFDEGLWRIQKKLQGNEAVPGLGDDAVLGFTGVLNVKKGDRDFTIGIVIAPVATAATLNDQKIQLAKLVLDRLQ